MGTNLLPYSSFESGAALPGSSDTGFCTVAFDTAHAYPGSGTTALKATSTGTSGGYVSPDNNFAYQGAVTPNAAYVASVWVYATAVGITCDVFVDQGDSSDTYITGNAASPVTLTANAWTRVVTTLTTGSTTAYVGTTFEFTTPSSGQSVWFDAAKIETGSTPSAWTPGPNDPATGLSAPTNLHTTAVGSTSFSLAWNAVTGASGYEVSEPSAPTSAPALSGTSGNGQNSLTWTTVSTATSYNLKRGATIVYSGANLSFTDTGLTNNTAYSYTVNAANAVGQGPYSGALPLTPAAPSGLPAKIVAGYWQRWQGPNVSEVPAAYNLQYAAVCQSDGGGGGGVTFYPDFEGDTQFRIDFNASKAAGCTWLLTVGGGGDGGIVMLTETNAVQMYNSLVPIIDSYGFQGVDWDLESGTGGWNGPTLKSASQKLKDHYGSTFIISAAPRPFEDYYRDWAVSMGSLLDLFGYQFYDYPEASDAAFQHTYISSRTDEAVGLGIPASKLMIGAICYSGYSAGHNTPQVYLDCFNEQKAKYPSIRGVFIWETSLDKLDGWAFASTMGPGVRGL
jgi:chitinase